MISAVIRIVPGLAMISVMVACTLFSGREKYETVSLPEKIRSVNMAQGPSLDASGYAFDPNDKSCDGYPRLKVQTMPGTCLGMVVSQNNNLDASGKPKLKMPRLIVKVPNTEHFLLTDMGGWTPKIGGLWWLKNNGGKGYSLIKVMEKLDLPHGLAFNERDQYFYLGENSRIIRFRFDPAQGKVVGQQTVVDNLTDVAKHMHPLTHFVFSPKTGDLFLNSGAPSDHCYQEDGQYKKRCPDETIQRFASIQKIAAEKLAMVTDNHSLQQGDVELVAQGLRNSMAMAIHPAGRFLIQGENSRDFPELEEPYEEMNVVRLDQPGKVRHYGWPYCFDNHAASPEWEQVLIKEKSEYLLANTSKLKEMHGPNPFYCGRDPIKGLKDYQRPYSLIPPHAAPLAAGYYQGAMFADVLEGQLLMSWHGHRTTGQRFVSYRVNNEGLPVLSNPSKEAYGFNLPNGCSSKAQFNPRGGLRNHFARYQEIISGWGPMKDVRPKGSPVGFAVANDGSILIVEDKNKTIVRLARSSEANFQQNCDEGPGLNKDVNIPLLAWRNALLGSSPKEKELRTQYIDIATKFRNTQPCYQCHENFQAKDLGDTPDEMSTLDYFVRNGWFVPGSPEKSLMFGAITANGIAKEMPPADFPSLRDTPEGRDLIEALRIWISALPQDIDSRWAQIKVNKSWNIRPVPTTDSKPCGQLQPDDIAYVDPRPASRVSAAGHTWSKVYLVPGHTRLSPGACKSPLDGVYWIATQ